MNKFEWIIFVYLNIPVLIIFLLIITGFVGFATKFTGHKKYIVRIIDVLLFLLCAIFINYSYYKVLGGAE